MCELLTVSCLTGLTQCQYMRDMHFHMPSSAWILQGVIWLMLLWRFLQSVDTLSPPPLSGRLWGTWRRSLDMFALILNRSWTQLVPAPHWRRAMSSPMDRSLQLVQNDLDVQRWSLTHLWLGWKLQASMRPPTTPSWNVMWIFGRTCMATLFSLEDPLCFLVLLIVWARRSLP